MTWLGKPSPAVPAWYLLLVVAVLLQCVLIVLLGTQSCAGNARTSGLCGLPIGLAWTIAAATFAAEALPSYLVVWCLHVRQIGADRFGLHLRFGRGLVSFAWADVFRSRTPARTGRLRVYLHARGRFPFIPVVYELPSAEVEPLLARFDRKLEFYSPPR